MNEREVTFWRVACNTIADNRRQIPHNNVCLAEEITFYGVEEYQLYRCTIPLLEEEEGEGRGPRILFHCIVHGIPVAIKRQLIYMKELGSA